jgi:two-component system C4-dicarboxylate transport response regulator DctD
MRDETLQYLRGLPWKGNVREVRNVIERAVIFAEEGGWIDLALLFPGAATVTASGNLNTQVEEYERRIIGEALSRCGGKVAQAALRLGISRTNLHNKMAKHGMTRR